MASVTVTMSPTYPDLGDEIDFTISVYNDSAVLAAATVALTVTLPDGTTSAPTLSTSVTGVYTGSYTPTTAGRFGFDVNATGTVVASFEGSFLVSQYAGLVSLEDARAHLNFTATTDDEELRAFVDRATAILEAEFNRALVRRTWTAEKHSGGVPFVALRHAPVISVTTATEDGSVVASTGYDLDGATGHLYRLSGAYSGDCWSSGLRNVSVTYVAGYTDPPRAAVQAVLELTRHLWDTQRVDRAGGRRPAGDDYTPGTSYSLPHRVVELMEPLRRRPA